MSQGNYRIVLLYDADRKTFTARAPELGHCQAEGATRAEAVARIEEEINAQLANMREHGAQPTAPIDEQELTGSFPIKVSRGLHRELLWQSHNEGIGIDQLAGELLAGALDTRRAARAASPRGPQPPQRMPPPEGPDDRGNRIDTRPRGSNYGARYHGILDDRANFIEYVRGLEQSHGGGGMGGRRGGRRRGRGGGGGGRGPGGPMRSEGGGGSGGGGSGGGGGGSSGGGGGSSGGGG
ncbi:MAG TPA: type II toxin-antitoxin system HicB family antitoxin, partial [Polyangia bacterium]|nr:type II toxin-antitoxin system HicB family antitoxin [Polyangia bacterium]